MPAVVEIECCGTTHGFKDFFEHLKEAHGMKLKFNFDLEAEWVLKHG
jgi:hypothetical protein